MMLPDFLPRVDKLIALALEEDIGSGDITTNFLVPPDAGGKALIIAKQELVLCGLAVAQRVFQRVDSRISFEAAYKDGQHLAAGQTVVVLQGPLAGLLIAERTALNFCSG